MFPAKVDTNMEGLSTQEAAELMAEANRSSLNEMNNERGKLLYV